jgi:S-adenosylmethionine hydrolase
VSPVKPIVLEANERWFIGPDNGLFELLVRQSEAVVRCWEITCRPETVSVSFHGRDIFSPVTAMIANGDTTANLTWGRPITYDKMERADWPNDWAHVIYIDRYGNCMTGLRWNQIDTSSCVKVGDIELTFAKTFSDCPIGNALCYQNSLGLMEFAIN